MRTTNFLARYEAGEHATVWAELVALGPTIRTAAYVAEAEAVATAMMQRARQNVTLLIERLHTLSYRFTEPYAIWQHPDDRMAATLTAVEATYGILPIVVHAWFSIVGDVDFSGTHPKLNAGGPTYALNLDAPTVSQPRGDALVVTCYEADYERAPFFGSLDPARTCAGPPFVFEIAPDRDMKEGYSGGDETRIVIPCPLFDTILFAEPPWAEMFFIPYLRTYFAWGGFPGLAGDHQAALNARAELAFLTKDLLPI